MLTTEYVAICHYCLFITSRDYVGIPGIFDGFFFIVRYATGQSSIIHLIVNGNVYFHKKFIPIYNYYYWDKRRFLKHFNK